MKREPNTEYILSLSYGKDSIACLEAIRQLGYPLDRIVHAEVWATDDIPADPPPMVEFKTKADQIIKERFGIEVEHLCATRNGEKLTYEKLFYHVPVRKTDKANGGGTESPYTIGSWCRGSKTGLILGFPILKGNWCTSDLKRKVLRISNLNRERKFGVLDSKSKFSQSSLAQGANTNIVQYLGIAADEPERITRHTKPGVKLPLVEIGWDEAYCRQWCEDNDLLSPIYKTAARGGCWFCHNQGVDQLRLLRKTYPDLWAKLMQWDLDSPTTFKSDGHTVHDYDLRFEAEDKGIIKAGDKKFRWRSVLEQHSE